MLCMVNCLSQFGKSPRPPRGLSEFAIRPTYAMFCDCLSIHRLVREAAAALTGGRVVDARQSADRSLLLRVRRERRVCEVVLSADAQTARLHLGGDDFGPVTPAPAFCELLKRRLTGGRVESVRQVGGDRIVEIGFAARDELGDPRVYSLMAELMGKHSNLVLLDEGRTIVEAIKRVPSQVNRYRVVLPRAAYVQPPSAPLDLFQTNAEAVAARLHLEHERGEPVPCGDAVRRLAPGLGRLLIGEVCQRAGVSPEQALTGAETSLSAALVSMAAEATSAEAPPFLVPGAGAGGAPAFAPCRLQSRPEAAPWESGGVSSLVAHCARAERAARTTTGKRSELLGRARRALQQLAKQRDRLAEELRKSEGADLNRQAGQAILANLSSIERGAVEVELTCPETGEVRRLHLLPDQTPVENADRYFKLHSRQKRALARLPRMRAETAQQLERLTSLINRAEREGDAETESELARVLATEEQPLVTVRGAHSGAATTTFIRHRLKSGVDAILGRSARENAALLSHVARSDDLWFHARGLPGPHGILRSPNKSQPMPPEAIREMARLIARRGKARRESTVAVDYCPVKHVRKVKGGAPGAVTYTHHKTLFVKNA
ncbi:MAG: hypothetical protein AUJ96_09920 [Armatimonadetes bacterium CG2_30_66_41]|nr:MAG: hypothetical protein AUJ96_09920 [Armatimonadetes bacterium CG2_30_66_41]